MEQSLIAKMRTLSIDYKATKLYFKCLKDGIANNEHNQDLIIQMTELINHEMTQPNVSQVT